MFDYLIVGAGLFGSVCARELTDAGRRCLVVEKRPHIGGQCYTEVRDGQIMNLYGGHIFHTNDRRLWEYVNRFSHFRPYSHHVKAKINGTVYSFPPNQTTYQQMGGINEREIREKFFRGYTEKMWGRPLEEVPPAVLGRIPLRDSWIDEYYTDAYQGLPEGGYTPMFERLLAGVTVDTGTTFVEFDKRIARRCIYTGPLDALFGYDRGRLEWRGLSFEHRREEREIWQGCATMNYTSADVPYLREEEWKFFWSNGKQPYSWVTRSYPDATEPLYPVNDERNNRLASEYKALAEAAGYIVGGRLGSFQYWNMDQCIASALQIVKKELDK